MLVDRFLPDYDYTVVRHVVVEADSETTYEAMRTADLTDLGPVVRALGWLRAAPTAVSNWVRGRPTAATPDRLRLADVTETAEWTLLAATPGREFVFGTVGKFWRPDIEWRPVDADDFARFEDTGYAKLACSLSVRPYGDGRTLLSYEARTSTTDERSRRRFGRYWLVVGPFAGFLMTRALDRMRRDAETVRRDAETATPRHAP